MVLTFRKDEKVHILRIIYEHQPKGKRSGMSVDAVERLVIHIYDKILQLLH
jgi:hypothetical protein